MSDATTPMSRAKDWPSLLEEIRVRPGLWIGNVSLIALEHYVRGFHLAEDLYAVPEAHRLRGFSFPEFEAWVYRNLNHQHLSIESFHLARCHSPSDEAAFHLWFSWYDAFLRGQAPPAIPPYPGTLPVY